MSMTLPKLLKSMHCLASRYTRKSKTDIEFASIKSRYGFLLTESNGVESSFAESVIKDPNHVKLFSLRTWKNNASSSSYVSSASSWRLMPSKDDARLS